MSATTSSGSNGAVLGATTTTAGATAVLPNTGTGTLAQYIAYGVIIVGVSVILSSLVRVAVNRAQ